MAKRITLKDVQHVNLEPIAFILEIDSNPDWGIDDIGCYWMLCLHLYINGGKIGFDLKKMAKICRCSSAKFNKSWEKIAHKFSDNNQSVSQKRVRKELSAARKRMQKAYTDGLKGAEKRWGSHSNPVAKRKRNENENETKTNTSNSKEKALSLSNSVRFVSALENIIRPKNQSDRTAIKNLNLWLTEKIIVEEFNQEIFSRVLDYAKEAKAGRNPFAVFFATLRREIGYTKQKF